LAAILKGIAKSHFDLNSAPRLKHAAFQRWKIVGGGEIKAKENSFTFGNSGHRP